MKNSSYHRKIYYVPGLLTLAFAPLLFIVKTNKYVEDRTEHCISIIAGINEDRHFILPYRNYQKLHLTGNAKNDSSTLIFIENAAKALVLSKNDSLGLKIILDNRLKYKTYVDLLNDCLKSGISDWIPFGDTVFVFHRDYPKYYNHNLCQNHLMPNYLSIGFDYLIGYQEPKPKPTLIQTIRNEKAKINMALPIAIVYFVLLYLALRKLNT